MNHTCPTCGNTYFNPSTGSYTPCACPAVRDSLFEDFFGADEHAAPAATLVVEEVDPALFDALADDLAFGEVIVHGVNVHGSGAKD